jgi:GT2 family glycosyltransferase
MIPVHVVVPTYRRRAKLRACLASLMAQTYPVLSVSAVEDHTGQYAIGVWNEWAARVTAGAFVYLCDDVELDPCCIERAVDTLRARWPDTDGVVTFRQRNIRQAQAAMGLIGARFLDRFDGRRPFCPEYSRFHFDSELGLAAKKLGRFHYERTATLVHHHPEHTDAPEDEAHARVRERAAVEADNVTWRRRRDAGLLWGVTDGLA